MIATKKISDNAPMYSMTFSRLIKSIILIAIIWFVGCTILAQQTIKIIKMKDQPIVVGKLNGKKAYFLVDTGADITILHLKDANRYKFNYRKPLYDYNISGLDSRTKHEVSVANNVNLYLGASKMEGCYKVYNLSNIIESIGNSTGIWINGIIGSDLMKRYHFLIDYGRQEIRFTEVISKKTRKGKACL